MGSLARARAVGALIIAAIFGSVLVALTPGTAHACSCSSSGQLGALGPETPVATLAATSGPVTVVPDEFFPTVEYEVDIIADPNDIFASSVTVRTTGNTGLSCGASLQIGQQLSFVLTEGSNGYAINACSRVAPDTMAFYSDYVAGDKTATEYCHAIAADPLADQLFMLERQAEYLVGLCGALTKELPTGETGGFFISYQGGENDDYPSRPSWVVASVETRVVPPPTPTPLPTAVPAPTATPAPTAAPAPTATAVPLVATATPVTVVAPAPTAPAPTASAPTASATTVAVKSKHNQIGFTG